MDIINMYQLSNCLKEVKKSLVEHLKFHGFCYANSRNFIILNDSIDRYLFSLKQNQLCFFEPRFELTHWNTSDSLLKFRNFCIKFKTSKIAHPCDFHTLVYYLKSVKKQLKRIRNPKPSRSLFRVFDEDFYEL